MSDSHVPHLTFIAPEPSELAPFFPGYEIEGLIATGGMGAVYRAVQKSLDRTVAIKILPQEFSKDAAFCAGFEAEAKAMARLNHPNLIGVYDFGEVNDMLFIIMEYVPGKSLYHSAHGLAIDPGEVVRLVAGICNGLAHAHSNGILHRDIKPSNILLDLNAQPKIGDFGLARPIGQKVEDGEDIFGTPHYTAPEVIHSPQSVDYRADLFSVGVLLHELLTGRLPADDPRPAAVIIRCNPRFDAIIRRATDPLPERRYASAAAIAKDLRAIPLATGSQNLPPVPGAGPKRAASSRPKTRVARKQSSGYSGILLCLILAAVGLFVYYRLKAPVVLKPSPARPAPVVQEPAKEPVKEQGSQAEPLPAPVPEPPPAATANPVSQARDRPVSESGSTLPAAGQFDVDGFLLRARTIMRTRAAPVFAKHQVGIKDNYWSFEQSLQRSAGRSSASAQLKQTLATWKSAGSRIPETLESSIAEIVGVPESHAKALAKQQALESATQEQLAALAPTYILGLQKQIERLEAAKDALAITRIQEEIDKTRQDSAYLPVLLLGMPPTP